MMVVVLLTGSGGSNRQRREGAHQSRCIRLGVPNLANASQTNVTPNHPLQHSASPRLRRPLCPTAVLPPPLIPSPAYVGSSPLSSHMVLTTLVGLRTC